MQELISNAHQIFFPAPSPWTLTGISVYLALTLQTVLIHISLKDVDA